MKPIPQSMLHKAFPSKLTEASRRPHIWSNLPSIRPGRILDAVSGLVPSGGTLMGAMITTLGILGVFLAIYTFYWIGKISDSHIARQKSFDTQIEEYVVPLQAQIDDLHNEVVELREHANMAPYMKYVRHGKVKYEIKKNGRTIGWEWK